MSQTCFCVGYLYRFEKHHPENQNTLQLLMWVHTYTNIHMHRVAFSFQYELIDSYLWRWELRINSVLFHSFINSLGKCGIKKHSLCSKIRLQFDWRVRAAHCQTWLLHSGQASIGNNVHISLAVSGPPPRLLFKFSRDWGRRRFISDSANQLSSLLACFRHCCPWPSWHPEHTGVLDDFPPGLYGQINSSMWCYPSHIVVLIVFMFGP